jgi:hypothetical protein
MGKSLKGEFKFRLIFSGASASIIAERGQVSWVYAIG